jgi:hypothetical protein
MQRFRIMSCYVVLVVAVLACTIEGIATLRAAPGHGRTQADLVLRSKPSRTH